MQKEDAYAIIFFIVIGLAIPAVVVLRHLMGVDITSFITPVWLKTVLGYVFAVLATLVCALNVYLSFVSPWLYKREHGTMEGYGAMSGIPVVGGFFVLFAGALIPESVSAGVFLLALYALDTGGMPWFFVQLLRGSA